MRNLLCCFIAIALLTSCASLVFKKLLRPTVEEIKLVHLNTKDEVVFIPMMHIGLRSFYDEVARKVDSLDKLGYAFIYETLSSNLKDSVQKDLVIRKYRKMIGEQPSVFRKGVPELDLISQPDYFALNVDTSKSVYGDVTAEELIAAFEQKNGEIKLSPCDKETGFEGSYDCQHFRPYSTSDFRKNYILGYRDSILVESFITFNRPKVAVIYGANHFKGFYKRLQEYDSNWKVVED